MPKMHLKQPGFTNSACGPFTKNEERIQKVKQKNKKNRRFKTFSSKQTGKSWFSTCYGSRTF